MMPVITVSNLRKAYGSLQAVENISFHADRGEIYALVGPDGSGKTTTMRIICNLVRPDNGSVFINDIDVRSEFERVKPILGYMPQIFSLYPDLSVEENLFFYAGIYGRTGRSYREKRDRLYEFSDLGSFSSRRAGALSGGMKQKLALSCALIHDPRLLLLDEPTTGVDPLSRRQFWEMLLTLKKEGTAIVVTTPYMDEVARVDRACFILEGRKLAEGTPSQLTDLFEGKVYFLDMNPTRELVDSLNGIDRVTARRFGSGLHLYTGPEMDIDQLTGVLNRINIGADKITPVAPDLEDCFIQVMENIR